jgi:hypothetical protein
MWTPRIRARVAHLACVLCIAAGAWPQDAMSKDPSTGVKTMTDVVIATFPIEPTVLSGQALRVRTVVDNRGSHAVEVPLRTEPSSFVYFLRSQAVGGPTYGLSQSLTDKRRSPDRAGAPPLETEPLAGGAKFEYPEDIAEFWNAGFEPGAYWLTVRYDAGGIESPKSAVTVLPLQVEAFSSSVSVDRLSSVAVHRREDGQFLLLKRESELRDPREGDFRVLRTWPAGSSPAVATSIDVTTAGNGRWVAWLRDGKLTAINVWGDRVLRTTEDVDVPGTLLSPGFQVGVGTAMFGAVSAQGRLDTYIASSTGLKKGWSAELGSAVARARWNAQADGTLTVAWEEAPSGRVLRQVFGADGRPRTPAPFAATPGRPLTWGLPASGAATIWVVVLDASTPVVARFPPRGDRVLTRLPELPGAAAWDLLRMADASEAIVAIAGDKLHVTRLSEPGWHAVADAPRASGLHLMSLNGRAMWAEWIESGYGIRRARVP